MQSCELFLIGKQKPENILEKSKPEPTLKSPNFKISQGNQFFSRGLKSKNTEDGEF
jgi:hypothetical protein